MYASENSHMEVLLSHGANIYNEEVDAFKVANNDIVRGVLSKYGIKKYHFMNFIR